MEQDSTLDMLVLNESSVPYHNYWDRKLSSYEHNQYFNDFRASKKDGARTWHVLEKIARKNVYDALHKESAVDNDKHLILLSALGVLAQKVSSIKDICILTPVYNNLHQEVLANRLVPVRMNDFSSNFKQFVQNAKDTFLEGAKHADYPLKNIFASQATDIKELSWVVMILEGMRGIENDTEPDMLFSFAIAGELRLKLKYDTEQFSESYIHQIADLYFGLLERLLISIENKLSEIELISSTEKLKILNEFNATDRPFLHDKTVVDLFKEQCLKFSERTAVKFKGISLTYRQLDVKSNQVANELIRIEVKKGDVVAVMLDRSIELPLAIFGILKAGCVYMPISKDYPDERILYSLRNSGCKVMFSKRVDAERFQDEFTCIDISELDCMEVTSEINRSCPESPAYLLYTSGSTGKPKGVLVKHRSLMNRLSWEQQQYPIDEHDVILQKTPLVFDVSMFELFWWTLTGSTMVLLEPGMEKQPSEISKLVEKEGVTIIHFVPAMLRAFLDWVVSEKCNRPLRSIKHVFTSGEELTVSDAQKLLTVCPNIKLHNLYGPTEATVEVSYFDVPKDYKKNRIPIGKPIYNTQLFIFNDQLQLQPIGVTGELYIGGENLALGYWGQPELTKEKFISHPFEQGERLYRTGDLARWNEDGDIEFLGRIDSQIKIRGNRVEMEEIEHTLSHYRGVRHATVLAKDSPSGYQLAAFIVSEVEISEEAIQQFLSSKLPVFMIPSYFVMLNEIPVNTNGKADRKKLLIKLDEQLQRQYIAPVSDLEIRISPIWSQVLGKQAAGVDDKFFTTGGDSILAVRLLAKINEALNIELLPADLYEYDTIRALANYIENHQFDDNKTQHKNIVDQIEKFDTDYLNDHPNSAIEVVYPMSDIEKGMCFVSMQSPSEILYIEQNFHPLSYKEFSFATFQKASWLLTQKHAALRTAFDLDNFAHVVFSDPELRVLFHNLSGASKKDQQNTIESNSQKALKGFSDLSKAPLWQMDVYQHDGNKLLMVYTGHHAIIDGWSYASFIKELDGVYNQLLSSNDFKPYALQSTYKEYIILESKQKLQSEAREFWRNELLGYNRLDFGVKSKEKAYKVVNRKYPASYFQSLQQAAQQLQIPVKHLLFAAYVYGLKMLTYENDLVVGMVTFKRPITPDGDKVLGCFLNTVPVRIKVSRSSTWRSFLKQVDKKLAAIRKYEGLSLFEIGQTAGEVYENRHPFFDTFFNYINFPITENFGEVERADNELDFENFTREGTSFNVSMQVNELGIRARYDYANTFLDDAMFSKFLEYYERFIAEVPEKILNNNEDTEIDLLSRNEKHQLLHGFNSRTVARKPNGSIIDLFERQVELHGNKNAILCENQYLSYAELNERSNKRANFLLAQGVLPDDRIGLYVERSSSMIVSLLAILKAGAAYLPLDTEYPLDRIHKMIEDANPKLIITDQSESIRTLTSKCPVLDFILEGEIIGKMPGRNPQISHKPNQAAYILYTSGSTGAPKGVLIEHASLMDYCITFKEYLSLKNDDSVIQQASLSFDTSVEEIFPALIAGSLLVIVPSKGRDIEKLLDTIETNRATVLSTTPVVLNELNKQTEKLSSLRAVISGGDLLLSSHVSNLIGKVNLYNSYGPTESTVCIAYQEIKSIEDVSSLGRPLTNRQVYILDKEHQLQPVGTAGELCVSGIGLAREYVGDAALTNHKFVWNPSVTGERMYKTGDLAKWDEQGKLEFLGRVDAQVKIRGNRIEPGEIEQILLEKGGVQQAAVIIKDLNGQKCLVAFIVSNQATNDADFKKYLSERLPDYMVPQYFVYLDSLPVTASHKVDIKKLSTYEITFRQEYAPPTKEVEKELVNIWQQILSKEKIGIEDNFFQSGGNSLTVITLKNRISKTFKIDMPVKEIFSRPTPKLLGEYLELYSWLQRDREKQSKGTTVISI